VKNEDVMPAAAPLASDHPVGIPNIIMSKKKSRECPRQQQLFQKLTLQLEERKKKTIFS
jgi:hypothetical protein